MSKRSGEKVRQRQQRETSAHSPLKLKAEVTLNSGGFSAPLVVKHEDDDLVLDLTLDDPPPQTQTPPKRDTDEPRINSESDAFKPKNEPDDGDVSLEPPLKKQLVVDESDTEKLKKMFKSKLKKHENMRLSDDVFLKRVRPIGIDPYPVALGAEFTHQMVPRKFLSNTYGGNPQETFPIPREEKLAEYGYDDFMFLPLDYQPFAPQGPGNTGLWLSTEQGDDLKGMQRVITRDALRAVWQYVGQYEVLSSMSLTREEWLAQSTKVRSTWGKQITVKKWGASVCVRVQARKELRRGEQLTQAKLDDVATSGRYLNATPEDIVAAYDRGEERLGVWTMKCVAYDEHFQRDICQKFANWAPPPKEDRKKKALPKGKKGVKQEKKVKKEVKKEESKSPPPPLRNSRGKKRKRSATPELDSGDDECEHESDNEDWHAKGYREVGLGVIEILDSDEEEVSVYHLRGTKSRPRCR